MYSLYGLSARNASAMTESHRLSAAALAAVPSLSNRPVTVGGRLQTPTPEWRQHVDIEKGGLPSPQPSAEELPPKWRTVFFAAASWCSEAIQA